MLRVLLVDDEEDVLNKLFYIVEWKRFGFCEVRRCSDATEALILLSQEMYHLVFIDLKMPKISGIQLIQEMKRRHHRALIVVLSNHEDYDQVSQAMRLGVFDYCIKKHLNSEEMQSLIRRASICYPTSQEMAHTGPFLLYYLTFQRSLDTRHGKLVEERVKKVFLGCNVFRLNDSGFAVDIEKNGVFHEISCFDYWMKLRAQLRDTLKVKNEVSRGIMVESIEALRNYLTSGIEETASYYRQEVFNSLIYIHQFYMKRISGCELARMACLHESYLARLFKQDTSKTICTYINELRVYKATELLRIPGIKIKEVAQLVGIQDQLYFNRLFNRQCGVSPKRYQERIKFDGII